MSRRVPASLERFLDLYAREAFWESHEALEAPWRKNRSGFYQGLILFASAFVHAQRGNPAGIRKQLAKVPPYLEPYRPAYLGIDVEAILAHARWAMERARRLEPARGRSLLPQVPPLPLAVSPARIRGDEPELREEDTGSGPG